MQALCAIQMLTGPLVDKSALLVENVGIFSLVIHDWGHSKEVGCWRITALDEEIQ